MIGSTTNVAIGVVKTANEANNNISNQTRIINVGKTWIEDYQYLVTYVRWEVLGQSKYNIFNQTISLDQSEDQDRIDRVVLNIDTDIISVKKGTKSATPSAPETSTSELTLFDVLVTANSTSAQVVETVVYKENLQVAGGEYNTNPIGGNINPDYTVEPITGAKSILFNNIQSKSEVIEFSRGTNTNTSSFDVVSMKVKLINQVNHRLLLGFLSTTNETKVVNIDNGSFGFDASNINEAQTIIIPKESITLTDFEFSKFGIFAYAENSSFIIDDIRFLSGDELQNTNNECCTSLSESSTVRKTGNTMVFTQDAFYNVETFLESGNIIIDGNEAVLDATVWQHCLGYVPDIETVNNEKFYESGHTPASNKLNIYKITFNGVFYDVVVDTKSRIQTPSPTYVVGDGQITIIDFSRIGAQSYIIKGGTSSDQSMAAILYSGDGLDLSPNYQYTVSLLTNGVVYYLWIIAIGNGFVDSLPATFSGTPTAAPFYRLYIGGVGGTISSAAILATYLEEDDASALNAGTNLVAGDINNFSVDSNNNVYAEIQKRFRLGYQAFNVNTDITVFIDLDGGMVSTNHNGFQACSSLRYFYSPTAAIRSNLSTGRNFRNIQSTFEVLYAPGDPVVGQDATVNNQEYDLLTTGIEIFAHPDSETNNSGGVEADIQNAIAGKSAVVTYVSNSTPPSEVSDLTGTNITANSIDLTFTPPSTTNPLLKYEVWVNGFFYDWITASGATVSGLTSGTNYDIQIKAADNQYNLSDLSNTYNFTTL